VLLPLRYRNKSVLKRLAAFVQLQLPSGLDKPLGLLGWRYFILAVSLGSPALGFLAIGSHPE
jgi:hypothetical protein